MKDTVKIDVTRSQCKDIADFIEERILNEIENGVIDDVTLVRDLLNAAATLRKMADLEDNQ